MRGFNLFAAFLGIAMIAVAMGYSAYSNSQVVSRLSHISTEVARLDTMTAGTIMKMDAYNTIITKIRDDFQDYFATHVIDPPEYVWDNEGAFKDWFKTEFVRSDTFTEWVAQRMLVELDAYRSARILGTDYDVQVVGSKEEAAEAIGKAGEIIINDDGTFTYILDTSKLSVDDYMKLPRLVVVKPDVGSVSRTEQPVLPIGKWSINIPLRVVNAYRWARAAKKHIESAGYEKYLYPLTGHCSDENLSVCGVYVLDGEGDDIVPVAWAKNEDGVVRSSDGGASIISACRYQYADLNPLVDSARFTDEELEKIYRESINAKIEILTAEKENYPERAEDIDAEIAELQEQLENADAEKIREEIAKSPCRDDVEFAAFIGQLVAEKTSRELQKVLDQNIYVSTDPEAYERYETGRIISRTGISITKIIATELTGPLMIVPGIRGLIDAIAGAAGGTISFDPCNVSGSVYCAAPKERSYIITWVDPDERYRMEKDVPAIFNFRVRGERPEYIDELEKMESESEHVQSSKNCVDEGEKEKIDSAVLAYAKEQSESIITSCYIQYINWYVSNLGLSDKDVEYIMNGLTAEDTQCLEKESGGNVEEFCKNPPENRYCPETERTYDVICKIRKVYAEEPMAGICTHLKIKGVEIPGITAPEGEAVCDGYYSKELLSAEDPNSGILDKIDALVEKVANKMESLEEKVNTIVQTMTGEVCNQESTVKKAVVYSNPLTGPICIEVGVKNDKEAKKVMAKFVEYNTFYHSYVEGILGNDETLKTIFGPPNIKESDIGGECGKAISVSGGQCYPDSMLAQAMALAETAKASVTCDVSPRNRVLFETLWMHIGDEIYSSCSVGAPKP